MKHFHTAMFLICGLILLQSCVDIQDPELTGIEDIKILKANMDNLIFTANMVFYNPNDFAVELESTDLVTLVEDTEVASLHQTYSSMMPARSAFSIPFQIRMDIASIYKGSLASGLGRAAQIFSDKKVQVRTRGTIDVRKGVAIISVPIDRSEWIKVRK